MSKTAKAHSLGSKCVAPGCESSRTHWSVFCEVHLEQAIWDITDPSDRRHRSAEEETVARVRGLNAAVASQTIYPDEYANSVYDMFVHAYQQGLRPLAVVAAETVSIELRGAVVALLEADLSPRLWAPIPTGEKLDQASAIALQARDDLLRLMSTSEDPTNAEC